MKLKTDLHAGAITVYGTEGCSWTRKQIALLKQKNIPFTFVDCDSQGCPDFVEGYPTVVFDGKIHVGFRDL